MEESTEKLGQRVQELEFQLAHQQRLVEQLNEVLVQHTRDLMRLEALARRLEEQVKLARELRKEAFDPGAEKPPHY
jgi:uncharacterized coiled-coil protein SlyX